MVDGGLQGLWVPCMAHCMAVLMRQCCACWSALAALRTSPSSLRVSKTARRRCLALATGKPMAHPACSSCLMYHLDIFHDNHARYYILATIAHQHAALQTSAIMFCMPSYNITCMALTCAPLRVLPTSFVKVHDQLRKHRVWASGFWKLSSVAQRWCNCGAGQQPRNHI